MLNFLDKLFTMGVNKLLGRGHEVTVGHDEVYAAHQAAHFGGQFQAPLRGSLQQGEVMSFIVFQFVPHRGVHI